jgi:hypothetical protein
MGNLSHYPRGLTGIALLLLRVSVGVLLLFSVQGGILCTEPLFVILLVSILSIGLAVGITTPMVGVAAALSRVALFLFVPAERSVVCVITLILCAVVSILGAGAYSFDGVLFGRRRIIL